jgi:DNA repair exonuclease SbcCD ATPase subunit
MDNDSERQYARFLYESLQEMRSLNEKVAKQLEEEKRLRREEGEKNSKEISRLTSLVEQLMKQIADLTNSLKSLDNIKCPLCTIR